MEAWLRQDSNASEQIVAMASRSLTDTEKRYSNTKREYIVVMFGLEKFEHYLLGRVTVELTTHHLKKPSRKALLKLWLDFKDF